MHDETLRRIKVLVQTEFIVSEEKYQLSCAFYSLHYLSEHTFVVVEAKGHIDLFC